MYCSRCRWQSMGKISSKPLDLLCSSWLNEAEGFSRLRKEGLHM
jgi:hypothetical protein